MPISANLVSVKARFRVGDCLVALNLWPASRACSSRCQTECACDTPSQECTPAYLAKVAGTPDTTTSPADASTPSSVAAKSAEGCSGCATQSGSALGAGLVTLAVYRAALVWPHGK